MVIATGPTDGELRLNGVAIGLFPSTISATDIAGGLLTFHPNADANGAGYATFTFQVRDDGGIANGGEDTDQTPNTFTIDVTAVNDAPVNNVPGAQTIDEDGSFTLSTANSNAISVADVDATTLTVTLSVAHGTLTLVSTTGLGFGGGSDGTADATMIITGSQTDINNALAAGLTYNPTSNYNGPDSLSVTTTDNGQTGVGATGTDADSIAITIVSVNDEPSGADKTVVINEDGSHTFATADFGFSDPADGDALLHVVIATGPTDGELRLNGVAIGLFPSTISATDIAGGLLTFHPNADANGAGYATFTFQVRDDGGIANGGEDTDQTPNTFTFDVNPVNDEPVLDLNGAGGGSSETLNYTENDPVTAIAPAATLTDIDTTNFNGARLLISMTNGINGEDILSIINQGTGPGQIGYSNGNITYEGVLIGNLLPFFPPPFPVLDIQLNFAGTVSPAAVQALLRAIGYNNISETPSTTPRNVTFQLNDGDGAANGGDPIGEANATINVTSVNDAPSVDLNGAGAGINAAVSFTEDGAPIAIGSSITVTDPDSGAGDQIVSATITLTDAVAGDALTVLGGLPAGITAVTTTPAGQIVITLSGAASQADYATAIGQIRYATSNQDPTFGGTDPARTITVIVNDGDAGSAAATSTVTITPVDDAPVAQPDAFTITESGTIVGGNLFASNGSGADADPDGPPLSISAVNGSGGNVGSQITLASGALLTVNANGTFNYNPNGAFLPTPTPGSGASNTPGHDSFTYTLSGGNTVTVAITLTGLDTDDLLLGTAGIDILIAGIGNDRLVGGASNDQLNGGSGVDTAEVSGAVTSFADTVSGWTIVSADGSDVLDGVEIVEAPGQRTLLVGATAFATIQAAFDNAETGNIIRLAAGTHIGAATYSDTGLTVISQPGAVINATFTPAGGQGITVIGAGAADSITTGGGNDDLNGGGGVDALAGGGGDDRYHVDNAADSVTEGAAGGFDRVLASADYVLAAGVEVEMMTTDNNLATTGIDLTGNALAQYLFGNAGANILDGGGGGDVMLGFGGDDRYLIRSAADRVVENVGEGSDRVLAAVDYTLTAGAEVEIMTTDDNLGTSGIDLTGNALAQFLFGNAGANTLDGGGGGDVLLGFGGNDRYLIRNGADRVVENTGEGSDRVLAAVDYTLSTGAEVEILSTTNNLGASGVDLTGNALGQYLFGDAGGNVLDGKGGNDVMLGLGGADSFAFTTALGAGNVDRISGFDGGDDTILLDDAVFATLCPGRAQSQCVRGRQRRGGRERPDHLQPDDRRALLRRRRQRRRRRRAVRHPRRRAGAHRRRFHGDLTGDSEDEPGRLEASRFVLTKLSADRSSDSRGG